MVVGLKPDADLLSRHGGWCPYSSSAADALLVVTEWKAFHHPDFEDLKDRMRRPLILDGRNLYEPHVLEHLGIAYQGIGRRNALALQWSPELTQESVSTTPAAL
jgi:hypothetical protein